MLRGLNWSRIAVSIVLMGLCSFFLLQAVIGGIVYGDIRDLPDRSTQATEVQSRSHHYLLACLLGQALTTVILAPALRSLGLGSDNSRLPRKVANYALAFGFSALGTGLGFLLLICVLKTLRLV